MAIVQQIYEYNVIATFILEGKTYSLPTQLIKQLYIDYDYDGKNMPIIYMTLSVEKILVDTMITKSEKGYIAFEVKKRLKNSKLPVWETYIKDQFTYVIPEDVNPNKGVDYDESGSKSLQGDKHREIMIGMLKTDLLNKNKRAVNGIFNNVTLMDLINYGTSNLPIIIEQTNSGSYGSIIIPPLQSVSKYIKYINSIQTLYNTPYRFFMDFNRSYLISSSGQSVPAKGDLVESIIITGEDIDKNNNKYSGQEYDSTQKVYNIKLSPQDMKISRNKISDKSYNAVIGVSSSGSVGNKDINTNKDESSTKKVIFERVKNENMSQINDTKQNTEGTSIIINLQKPEIDGSIITPNKSYNIKNFKLEQGVDGKYLLGKKIEIFSINNSLFSMLTIMELRKII